VGNTLIVVHDDAAGIIAAATAAVLVGGAVIIPSECTIYGSQAAGLVVPNFSQFVGTSLTPSYQFQGQGTEPIVRIIAPTGAAPAAGFNLSNVDQASFSKFEVTTNINNSGLQNLGFLKVPVAIGVVGNTGMGSGPPAGESPGIVLDRMTLNAAAVGFGAPIGGNAKYMFGAVYNSNFIGNTAGTFGPFSDSQFIGNDFVSNGAYGSYGAEGGMVFGPQQGAPGSAGASRIEYDRFEFNKEGIVVQNGTLLNLEGNQFDGNTWCGLDLNTFWSNINITGGWFRGNANGGAGGVGSVAAGKDADVCFNGGAGSGGYHESNVDFYTNYSEGNTAPLGSTSATTPAYVYDFNTAGSNNANFSAVGGDHQFIAGNNGAAVSDISIFRNGKPSPYSINVVGQAVLGANANGYNASQSRGQASHSWSAYTVIGGDYTALNNGYPPANNGYAGLIGQKINASPTYLGYYATSHFDCDAVNAYVVPNINPQSQDNPVITWLASTTDPTFGGGSYSSHLADTNVCRMGALVWMTTPTASKVFAQNGGWTNTGTWTNSSLWGGNYGVVSNTNGDTAVGSITTTGQPIYYLYAMNGSNGGTFTVTLDSGTPSANINTQGNNTFTYPISSSSYTLGAVRIPAFAGAHTVKITVTSSTSSSNTVIPIALATAPTNPVVGSGPTVFMGGQIFEAGNAEAAAVSAFNTAIQSQVSQLFADGLSVHFVNVQNFVNSTTSMRSSDFTAYPLAPSPLGQSQIAAAFEASMQETETNMGSVNPIQYGAACNTQMFVGNNLYTGGYNAVYTTSGSPIISIQNYTFQPGVATQTGGGDVGKVISIFLPGQGSGGNNNVDVGPTTYIASVNTATNTATLGENMATTSSGAGANTAVMMGGYPSNPNLPSTAQDDTAFIQQASAAAQNAGGKVFLPTQCLVHNLSMENGTQLIGSNGGNNYGSFAAPISPTVLYGSMTGYASDVDYTNNQPRNRIIDIGTNNNTSYKDFTIVCGNFPSPRYYGNSSAAFGALVSPGGGNNLNPERVLIDHVTQMGCPVGVGAPLEWDLPVTFTATISGTTMTVSSINSTNLSQFASYAVDFLGVGRTFTGSGVPANEQIIAAPQGGQAGTYTVSIGTTVASPTAMTSAAPSGYVLSGTFKNMEQPIGAVGFNGDFSDASFLNNINTGLYWGGYIIGPSTDSAGCAANRIVGGRDEEGGVGVYFDGCPDNQIVSHQFQYNGGYAVQTYGGASRNSVQSSWIQPYSGQSAFGLGGSGTHFTSDGNIFYLSGSASVADTVASAPSGVVDYVTIEGGDVVGLGTQMINPGNGTPTHQKINIPAQALVDTTQSVMSIGTTGIVGIGITNSINAGIALDMGSTTGAVLVPVGTTGQEPASPVVGELRYNSTTHSFEGYGGSSPAWASLGGSGTGTVSSIIAGTGLSGGTITTTGTIAISSTAVSAGSYGSATSSPTLTVNAQGQLTAASNVTITPAWTSITGIPTTLAGYGIINPLNVAQGGTAAATFTAHGVLIGEGTSAIVATIAGTAGYVLESGGASADPSYAAQSSLSVGTAATAPASGLTGTTLASNVVSSSLTSVGTIATGVWDGTPLTSSYLPAGTVIAGSSPAQGDIIYYNGTKWVDLPAGTSGYVLQTNGVSANPGWANPGSAVVSFPLAGTSDTVSTPDYSWAGHTTTGLYYNSGIGFAVGGVNAATLTSTGLSIAGTQTITSASSSALTVGANGATNPVLTVDDSTASVATGIAIKGAATGGTSKITATDSGANTNLDIEAKGTGLTTIAGTGTGGVQIGNNTGGSVNISAGAFNNFILAYGSYQLLQASGTYNGRQIQFSTNTGVPGVAHYYFASGADTGLTASASLPVLQIGGASPVVRQWATGTLADNYQVLMGGTKAGFVGASAQTLGETLEVLQSDCGTNGTCSSLSALTVPTYAYTGTVTSGYGINVSAPSGAIANYAANFIGNVNLTSGSVLQIANANALSFPTSDTTAGASIAIGASALSGQTSSAAYGNTAVGYQAMGLGTMTTAAVQNVAVGQQALSKVTSGTMNEAIGFQALQNNTTGSYNAAIGRQAMLNNTTGSNNTIVGTSVASTTLTTGSNNILIGTSSATDANSSSQSNEINIGGLLFWNSNSLAAPALSACGTSTIDTQANNRSGTINITAGTPASCTMTFAGTGYGTWNHCRVTSQSVNAAFAYSYTKTVLTVTGTALAGKIDYDCDGV